MDPEAFSVYMKQNEIDCLKIVPSHFESLLIESNTRDMLPKKYLILGGEALSIDLLIKIQKSSTSVLQIFNHYGPTEATIGCCMFEVPKLEIFQGTGYAVPIGRPIANTQLYILDDNLKAVPIGVRGELYIGGAGLAAGYLNQPELTRQKFIDNPFVDEEKKALGWTRLYKTGDVCRYLPDGNIEYLGRSRPSSQGARV